ncbi:MAG: glycerol-3-phosphate dehydrogenase [Chitinophagaceae bacterium]|nr:MAG: glycerol-3-phosphate dehydrogenase [Chitinophagaceae bacterium]
MALTFGIIGSGSWATALAKILTNSGNTINWWVRNEDSTQYILKRRHNPNYLSSAYFDTSKLNINNHLTEVIHQSDVLLIAIPSAHIEETFGTLDKDILNEKLILSAVKGLIPGRDILVNEYLLEEFNFPIEKYFALLGPCHAEEVAAEKLSYLTFSGVDDELTKQIASYFKCAYINTVTNNDILGVQYAAVLKNIYALGAGIAHGLEYGDNFQSVYIANCADEMAMFLRKFGAQHIVVGEHDSETEKTANYAASVYLGDLLVTCYSMFSRNRTFGHMIGKGYSVQVAKLELNMVAEGYNASKCIYNKNKNIQASMPIAKTIYDILWNDVPPHEGFQHIESVMI